ncbi:MAG: hypothetical protein N3B10_13365 [Armatimonadetes bacterium]|nr:hypothetical protein [Armatimonadota bacterium]
MSKNSATYEISPTKVGSEIRQRLWVEAHSMVGENECFVVHATGFSQWSLTNQNKRRIHSARFFHSTLGQRRPDSCQSDGAVGAFFCSSSGR